MRPIFLLVPLLATSAYLGAQTLAKKIELTPTQVNSASTAIFSRLPTSAPSIFGLIGRDVRKVNFDKTPTGSSISSGTRLTTQYASIGVVMNSIRVLNSVFGGPASAPNATHYDSGHVFNFTVPVAAAGIINTSPDHDRVQLWTGPNGTGTKLLDFVDQAGLPKNYNIDRFVGGRANPGFLIGSMLVSNAAGNCELDELIFEACASRIAPYGLACRGTNQKTPSLLADGCTEPGGWVTLSVSGDAGAQMVIVVGLGRASIPFLGCRLLVSPQPLLLILHNGTLDSMGRSSSLIRLPSNVAPVVVNLQAGVFDQVGAGLTEGAEIDIR